VRKYAAEANSVRPTVRKQEAEKAVIDRLLSVLCTSSTKMHLKFVRRKKLFFNNQWFSIEFQYFSALL
jgi:hypothetical protein